MLWKIFKFVAVVVCMTALFVTLLSVGFNWGINEARNQLAASGEEKTSQPTPKEKFKKRVRKATPKSEEQNSAPAPKKIEDVKDNDTVAKKTSPSPPVEKDVAVKRLPVVNVTGLYYWAWNPNVGWKLCKRCYMQSGSYYGRQYAGNLDYVGHGGMRGRGRGGR